MGVPSDLKNKYRQMKTSLPDVYVKTVRQIVFLLVVIAVLLLFLQGNTIAQNIKVTFSEINYKSDKSMDPEDWVELWNYGDEAVDLAGWRLGGEKFNEFFEIPPGVVLSPDQRLVLCRNDNKFKEIYPDVSYLGPFVFRLSGKGQSIRLFDKNNSLYLQVNYKDTLPWPKTPDGYGKTLEIRDPEADINDGNNWFAGCVGGSPGKPHTPCKEKIIFSEVCYSSGDIFNSGDWIELRNISQEAVDVSGWKFSNRSDSNEFFLPPNTVIQSGGNLVLARRNKFSEYYPFTEVIKPFDFGLRSGREIARIYDQKGKIYNSMFFHNEHPWPVEADDGEKTLEIKEETGLLCDPQNWFAGCKGGSPGEKYNADCILKVNYLADNILLNVYPNPFKERTRIEITGIPETENVKLDLYDYSGRIVKSADIRVTDVFGMTFYLDRGNLSPGIYIYHLSGNNIELSSGKIVIKD